MREKRCDVITVDPSPPIHSAGTVNLYSREFFRLCRERLTPGGVMCLWIPPSPKSDVQMIISTFLNVFADTLLWRGPRFSGFYLIGTLRPQSIPLQRFRRAFGDPGFLTDINEWDDAFHTAADIADLLVLDARDVAALVAGTPIITDNHPYTEFPLWRRLREGEVLPTPYTGTDVLRWKAERRESSY